MLIIHTCKQRLINFIVKGASLFSKKVDEIFVFVCLRYEIRVSLREKLKLLFLKDMHRFQTHSWYEAEGTFRQNIIICSDPASLSAVITMEYHRIEKGMALPDRRPGAGQDAAQRLILAIAKQLDVDKPSFEGAIGITALTKYFEETPSSALDTNTKVLLPLFNELKSKFADAGITSSLGGYSEIGSEEFLNFCGPQQVKFLKSRHSIRDFSKTPVDRATIEESVCIAMSAPSVCNRQAWHLYALTDKNKIRAALAFQNGNKGFTEKVPVLFVVASDLRHFVSVEERNQAWIDGGLFSMMLSLGLHAKGLGSCMLNWCATRENDESVRRLLKIPEHEIIIMMMAAGYLPNKIKVTSSPRRETSAVLTVIN